MGFLDGTGSQTLFGSGVVKSESEPENDSVLFEDSRGFEEFVPETESDDRITFPTMPAELENYGTEIDPQVSDLFFTLHFTSFLPRSFNKLKYSLLQNPHGFNTKT